jgi:secreted trypsin-like serine protease
VDQSWERLKSPFKLPGPIEYLEEFYEKLNFTQKSLRIIGGRSAKLGQFPYQVLLYVQSGDSSETFLCGGSIIGSEYILTVTKILKF